MPRNAGQRIVQLFEELDRQEAFVQLFGAENPRLDSVETLESEIAALLRRRIDRFKGVAKIDLRANGCSEEKILRELAAVNYSDLLWDWVLQSHREAALLQPRRAA